jgi:hypothetical protein
LQAVPVVFQSGVLVWVAAARPRARGRTERVVGVFGGRFAAAVGQRDRAAEIVGQVGVGPGARRAGVTFVQPEAVQERAGFAFEYCGPRWSPVLWCPDQIVHRVPRGDPGRQAGRRQLQPRRRLRSRTVRSPDRRSLAAHRRCQGNP